MSVEIFTKTKPTRGRRTYSPWDLVTIFLSLRNIRRNAIVGDPVAKASVGGVGLWSLLCFWLEFSLESLLKICLFYIEVWNPTSGAEAIRKPEVQL